MAPGAVVGETGGQLVCVEVPYLRGRPGGRNRGWMGERASPSFHECAAVPPTSSPRGHGLKKTNVPGHRVATTHGHWLPSGRGSSPSGLAGCRWCIRARNACRIPAFAGKPLMRLAGTSLRRDDCVQCHCIAGVQLVR